MPGDQALDPSEPPLPAPPGFPDGFGEGPAERHALYTLSALRGITPRRLHAVIWDRGSAAAALAAIASGRAGSPRDRAWVSRIDPDAIARALAACDGRMLTPADAGYPRRLLDLQHDPPAWLFVRGQDLRHEVERIAIVGARKCSDLGRDVAHDLGRRLGGVAIEVVSGGAFGIDAAAHRGALAADAQTVAVLGSGIDVTYPRSSAGLLTQIMEKGTLVSEYPPGQRAEPHHFPARNRIVVALSRAVVVVEGAGRSGSRISVDHALDLGREVFAVPGPVSSPLSETPLEIIRDGATLIRGADDLLADLGYTSRSAQAPPPPRLNHEEERVWNALGAASLPDAVARAAGLSVPEAVTMLIHLELRGLVRATGGRYERTLATGAAGQA